MGVAVTNGIDDVKIVADVLQRHLFVDMGVNIILDHLGNPLCAGLAAIRGGEDLLKEAQNGDRQFIIANGCVLA